MTVPSTTHTRRALAALAAVAVALTPTAAAAQSASPQASCVAVITSYEASQLPAGSVGHEVSGLARSVSPLGSELVGPLARRHLGSVADCAQAEG